MDLVFDPNIKLRKNQTMNLFKMGKDIKWKNINIYFVIKQFI